MSGPGPDPRTLRVVADLSIEVDGTSARLTSEGDRLLLTSSHPERVWAAVVATALPAGVGRVDGPRAVGRIADGLADAGLRLEVTGPRGSVVHLGAGVGSGWGRVLAGSAAVGPGKPAALAALAWERVPRAAAAAALTGTLVLAGAVRAARRRSSRR